MIATSEAVKSVDRMKESKKFYNRLHSMLAALERIEGQLPREQFAPFIKAYSQHWLYSLKHGEKASSPRAYYDEWAEIQQLGSIPMDTERSGHEGRRYGQYESPREKARRVLGFDDNENVSNGAATTP